MNSRHISYSGFRRLEDWSLKRYLGHHFEDFKSSMSAMNFRRLLIINGLMMITETILLILPEPGIPYHPVLMTFVLGNMIIIPMLYLVVKRPSQWNHRWQQILLFLDVSLIIFLALGLTLVTQGIFDYLHVLIGMLFIMVSMLYLPSLTTAVMLLIVTLLYALLMPLRQPDASQQFILVNNLIIFSLGTWVIGFLVNRDRATTFKAQHELEDLLKRDIMTKFYNHDTILELIDREVELAKADHQPLSMLMLDLDDFKAINDTHGHQKGDEVLLQVVEVLRKTTRTTDLIGRYGGEEFLILFTRTELPIAYRISERIRSAIEAVNLTGITVTVSGGLTQLSDESAEAFIKIADDRLYQAKRSGKNKIITV